MFLPIRTDRRLNTTPWVNYALIAVNAIIFLMTLSQITTANEIQYNLFQLHDLLSQRPDAAAEITARIQRLQAQLEQIPVLDYYLQPEQPQLFQFVSYQFLHGGWMHLLGNMVFLYVFGNSVEDRLGHVAYLFFYLGGGVIAGLGHALAEISPVIGASGAVAAVTGAYLALFPLSNVTVIYWFFFIGAFEVSGMILILFRIGWDILSQFMGGGNVAYLAHLAGYADGFAVGMLLLLVGVLPREPYDMLSLIAHRRRRSRFQRMAKQGYQPWDHTTPGEPGGPAAPPPSPEQQQVMEARAEVSRALAQHDMPAAAELYRQLIEQHPEQVFGRQQQLDLANQLMAEGQYATAATAYELFLRHYPGYPQRSHVQLILGLIYGRYMEQPDRARELLTGALPDLQGSDRELAQSVLTELGGPAEA